MLPATCIRYINTTRRSLYMLYYSSPQLSNSACNRVHDKQAVEAKVRDDDIIIRIPVQNADSRHRMTAQNYTLYSVCLSVCSSVCLSRDNLLLENEQTFRGGYLREELMAVSSQCYCGGGAEMWKSFWAHIFAKSAILQASVFTSFITVIQVNA